MYKRVLSLLIAVTMIFSLATVVSASGSEELVEWDFELGDFNWELENGVRGWSSNGVYGFDGDLKLSTLLEAKELVLELSESPEGKAASFSLQWAGDGKVGAGDGKVAPGTFEVIVDIADVYDEDTKTITIDLAKEIQEHSYKEFEKSEKYLRLGLNYLPNVDALSIEKAYLNGKSKACNTCKKFPCECAEEKYWKLDLKAFTWDNDEAKGWYSDGAEGESQDAGPHNTELEFNVLMNAFGIIIETDGIAEEGDDSITLSWVGDTRATRSGFSIPLNNVHDVVAKKMTFVFEETWNNFRKNTKWAGIGFSYRPNVAALNIKSATLFGKACDKPTCKSNNGDPLPCICSNITPEETTAETTAATTENTNATTTGNNTTAPTNNPTVAPSKTTAPVSGTTAASNTTGANNAATTTRVTTTRAASANDTNPKTGVAFAIVPALIAGLGAVVSGKKKK